MSCKMIYGIHAVQTMLARAPERFQEVFLLKGRQEDKRLLPLIHTLKTNGVIIRLVTRHYLDEKSDGVHQGIVARVKPCRQYQENDLLKIIEKLENPFLLILDGVTDSHNLGACLRSADAAGVHAVIVPRDR